jgi:hypothetical protein
MLGFVHTGGPQVMKCFAPTKLPVLTSLATHYAICDQWYSSVPGSTSPNRKFAHAAQSEGSVSDDLVWLNLPTIYEEMDLKGIGYRIYKHDMTFLMTVEHLAENQSAFRDFENQFEADCADGSLPEYTWIEPRYNPQDNFPPSSTRRSSRRLGLSSCRGPIRLLSASAMRRAFTNISVDFPLLAATPWRFPPCICKRWNSHAQVRRGRPRRSHSRWHVTRKYGSTN